MDFQKVFKYTQNLNVLYVEDNEELLQETSDVFEDFFANVQTAINGQEALKKYQEKYNESTPYDLVITDINMPVMDGLHLIKEIHKLCYEQNIIVISAYNESSRLTDLIQEGITNFVMKPIAPTQLMNILYKTAKSTSNQKELIERREELEDINKNLDEKVQDQAKEILFTQKISIETIANMVESYDDETGTHIKRIENYTQLILSKVPISPECTEDVHKSIPFASLLHDIGKLMVPKHILTKNAKLTLEEFEIIKTHAKLGGDVLKQASLSFYENFNKDNYLKVASDIAMYHHEKWDGSGYPEGLQGEQIPLSARVVSIADVYDALRSKRVYKEGFSHEESVEIINSQSGISFDPKLITIFLELEGQFNETFNRLS